MTEISIKDNHFSIQDGAIAGVLFIALQFLFYVFLGAMPSEFIENKFGYVLASILLELLFFAASIIIAKYRKIDFAKSICINKKVNWKMVLLIVCISVVCLVLFSNLTASFMGMLEKCGYYKEPPPNPLPINSFLNYLLAIVSVCIVPAICEEIMFRGVMLSSLKSAGKWVAITVSSVCFMLMHGNPEQTIHQLILGFVLGYICWETKNIWVTILIHFFNNLFAITIEYISNMVQTTAQASTATQQAETWQSLAITFVVGILLAAFGFYVIKWFTGKLKKYQTPTEQDQTEQVITVTQDGKSQVVEEKPIANKTQIILSVCFYVVFATYFLYEWIHSLMAGF